MSEPKIKIEKIVYFVRHVQSVDNISPVFQSPDSPLNEIGKKQAENIAERVSRLSFEALIASPLQRTKETAEAIAKGNVHTHMAGARTPTTIGSHGKLISS